MTDLDEIFNVDKEVKGGSNDKVVQLLTDIKNRLHNAIDYKALADKMDIKQSELLKPKGFTLDLTAAHDNKAFNLPGSKIVISEITGEADLRFNLGDEPIPLQKVREIPNQNGFTKFYISNKVQKAGTSLTGIVTTIDGARSTPAPKRHGRPYGQVMKKAGTSIAVPAGNEVSLATETGYGWLLGFNIRMDYDSLGMNLYRDGSLVFPQVELGQAFDGGLTTAMDNYIQPTLYDSKNSLYVGVWDPARPYYYNNDIELSIVNQDTADHNVIGFSLGYMTNTP